MKISSYEEKLKLVNEFIKINSPSKLFERDSVNEECLPKYRNEQVSSFGQVEDWLYLNGITRSENKDIYDKFKHNEKLCNDFLKVVLTATYFKL